MSKWMMAVPLMVDEESHDMIYWEEMRSRLLTNRCNRVFLTIDGKGAAAPVTYFKEQVPKLIRLGKFFREVGIEPAVWLGHSIGHGSLFSGDDDVFPAIVDCDAVGMLRTEPGVFCPLGDKFQAYLSEVCATLATSHLPMLMLDDDYRLGLHGLRFGCFCPLHMEQFHRRTGLELSAEELTKKIRTDYEVRRLWCENNRDSLYALACLIEKAVHAVDPEMRIGLASSPLLRTGDGIDIPTLMQCFNAGRTRPFVRTAGAPYWNRNSDHTGLVIEYSRLQAFWLKHHEIEVFAEGDTFPHNTFVTPASSLRAYDEGLAASGFPGILSYQYSYGDHRTTDFAYDRETRESVLFHTMLRKISHPAWQEIGFEVSVPTSEFLYRKPETAQWDEFKDKAIALQILPRLGIPLAFGNPTQPVVLAGDGCAAYSDDELRAFLKRGTVLDAPAAQVLLERGMEIGVDALEKQKRTPTKEDTDTGIRSLLRCFSESVVWKCDWRKNALVRQCSMFVGGIPGIAHLRTADGNKIVIVPWDLELAGTMNCNYIRQRQWQEAYCYLAGQMLPVVVTDHADIRLHQRMNPTQNTVAVSVQNLSLDQFNLKQLVISSEWEPVQWLPPKADALARLDRRQLFEQQLNPMNLCVLQLSRKSEK